MDFYKWEIDDPLTVSSLGIPQPIKFKKVYPDILFVPIVAFDKHRNRIGYGAGFYDNFFKKCNPKILKIGLSFFEPEIKIEDTNPNDVKLDFCITPNKIFSF